ncbi:hypothetical protein CK203_014704 [Vitis vinifera]|uniref:Uncharacterized protein n=1 Tax=Vitis vinifera TaxID=29760 RepID=A0A438JG02_VITVI|nr:hypothetical protein CK203_068516 [Vitis vinifera]RVX07873.1 hypothetical protein CK203_014704 [Vitis vinifera]
MADEGTKEELHRDLYKALMNGDEKEVIQPCKNIPEGPCTQLAHQNDAGNTILHEAATASRTLPAARETLKKASQLLRMQNDYGETPLFQAAQYGKKMMFKFLADVVDKECLNEEDRKVFFQRKDEATILRVSNFKEKDKTMERDDEGPQVKVCKPISYISDFGEHQTRISHKPLQVFNQKDTSWKVTDPRKDRSKPKSHKYGHYTKPFSNEKEGRYELISTPSLGQEKGENSPIWSLETHKPSFSEDIGPEDEEKEVASPQSYITLMRTGETPLLLATICTLRQLSMFITGAGAYCMWRSSTRK